MVGNSTDGLCVRDDEVVLREMMNIHKCFLFDILVVPMFDMRGPWK